MKASETIFLRPQERLLTCRRPIIASLALAAALLILSGCATRPGEGSIYVPVGGSDQTAEQQRQPAEAPQSSGEASEGGPSIREPEPQPRVPEPRAPSHRTESQAMAPAAAGLVKQADQAFRAGNVSGGMALLQRAQRISPDAAVIYYKMAEGYVLGDSLPRAEQFARKGISVAGANQSLQKSGWQLLSDIRRAQGNIAGAQNAEERAGAL